MSGMDVETIRRGRRELDEDLTTRPADRVLASGGGQPAVEKRLVGRDDIREFAERRDRRRPDE
jgi:hypothetical protein